MSSITPEEFFDFVACPLLFNHICDNPRNIVIATIGIDHDNLTIGFAIHGYIDGDFFLDGHDSFPLELRKAHSLHLYYRLLGPEDQDNSGLFSGIFVTAWADDFAVYGGQLVEGEVGAKHFVANPA